MCCYLPTLKTELNWCERYILTEVMNVFDAFISNCTYTSLNMVELYKNAERCNSFYCFVSQQYLVALHTNR